MENYFTSLNSVNVAEHIEKKNGLSYLSWAWAWGELKKRFPDATYTVYENLDGWNYFTDGRTCWVKTGVTVNGVEHIEYLPVMDYRNKSIALESVTSFDVNKTIQRSLTKAVARHGLGLYIYAGEDLPEDAQSADKEEKKAPTKKDAAKKNPSAKVESAPSIVIVCEDCGKNVEAVTGKNGNEISAPDLMDISIKRFKKCLCASCQKSRSAKKSS